MDKVIEIQLGEYRPVHYFDMNNVACQRRDYVIVEVDRGSEFGRVVSNTVCLCPMKEQTIMGKVLRKATDGDLKQIENNRMKAKDAMSTCIRKITDRKLEMQVIKAEYTFDSSKIIFTFLAEGRIDFRNFVKELARIFRVRIELRQIGVRDKAKVVCGYGVCGRPLCCSSYMKSFHPLSIKMAKDQGQPLGPSRILGICGRIKCCMAYEFFAYKDQSKNLPRVGEKITTPEGKGKVLEVNILKRIVLVDLGEGRVIKMAVPKKDEE